MMNVSIGLEHSGYWSSDLPAFCEGQVGSVQYNRTLEQLDQQSVTALDSQTKYQSCVQIVGFVQRTVRMARVHR